MRCASEMIRTLAGFEQAASHRIGTDGRQCYRGIAEGDGLAELARRCRYPESSTRSIRRLVQITMEALSEYETENRIDLGRWNARA